MRALVLSVTLAAAFAVFSAKAEVPAAATASATAEASADGAAAPAAAAGVAAPAADMPEVAVGALKADATMPKQGGFSVGFEYMATTDLADELEPRIFEHSIEATVGYDLGKGFSAFGIGTFYYQTLGRGIVAEDHDNPSYWEADVGIAKRFDLGSALWAKHGLKLTAKNSFPVSDDNRYEAIRSIPGVGASVISSFFDSRVTLVNAFAYRYILHTYYYSPVSGTVNTRDTAAYLGTVTVNIIGGLSATLGTGLKLSRKVDGSNDYSYNNLQMLAYSFGKLGLSLTHQNGGFTREGDVSLWYVDQYRRIVSGAVSYNF